MKTIRMGVLILFLALGSTGPAAAQFTATIVGSGSPSYDEARANASVLISNGETRILVDMGDGAQANLWALGVKPSTLSALLITRHHLDHNEEFVPLLIHSLMGRRDFEIYGPPNTVALTETTLELYAEDIDYRLGKTGRALEDRRVSPPRPRPFLPPEDHPRPNSASRTPVGKHKTRPPRNPSPTTSTRAPRSIPPSPSPFQKTTSIRAGRPDLHPAPTRAAGCGGLARFRTGFSSFPVRSPGA